MRAYRGENDGCYDGYARVTENAPVLLEECDKGFCASRSTDRPPQARNALSVTRDGGALLDALAARQRSRRPGRRHPGAGPAFCAGHDLRELRTDQRRVTYERLFAQCSELMLADRRLPKPVIAEVHGGDAAGCQLVATWRPSRFAAGGRPACDPRGQYRPLLSTPMVALTRAVGARRRWRLR